eukprot:PhM_4_TR16155/c1_g1_i16/m.77093
MYALKQQARRQQPPKQNDKNNNNNANYNNFNNNNNNNNNNNPKPNVELVSAQLEQYAALRDRHFSSKSEENRYLRDTVKDLEAIIQQMKAEAVRLERDAQEKGNELDWLKQLQTKAPRNDDDGQHEDVGEERPPKKKKEIAVEIISKEPRRPLPQHKDESQQCEGDVGVAAVDHQPSPHSVVVSHETHHLVRSQLEHREREIETLRSEVGQLKSQLDAALNDIDELQMMQRRPQVPPHPPRPSSSCGSPSFVDATATFRRIDTPPVAEGVAYVNNLNSSGDDVSVRRHLANALQQAYAIESSTASRPQTPIQQQQQYQPNHALVLRRLEAERDEAKAAHNAAEQRHRAVVDDMERLIESLNRKVAELSQNNHHQGDEDDKRGLEELHAQLESAHARLAEQGTNEKVTISSKDAVIEELRQQLQQCTSTAVSEGIRIQAELAEANRQLEALRPQLSKVRQLESELEIQKTASSEKQTQALARAYATIDDLRAELVNSAELKQQLETARSERAEAQKASEEQQATIEKLRSDL